MRATRAVLAAVLAVVIAGCVRGGETPAASASADPARPLPSPLPDVVARVNGRPVGIASVLPLAKVALDRVSVDERDRKLPAVLRQAVAQYVDRELLLQEALARGIAADARRVEQAYDRARAEHPQEAAWNEFLRGLGFDAQSFRAELRVQQTLGALFQDELQKVRIPAEDVRALYGADPFRFASEGASGPPPFEDVRSQVEEALRQERRDAIVAALAERLRSKARIEILL